MARNCFTLLRHCGLRAQLPTQSVQRSLLYTRHGVLPLHKLLLSCAVNQKRHFFKSTHSANNAETDRMGKSNPADREYTKALLEKEGFQPIYRLQYAHMYAAINKVKWIQLYLTAGGVPLSILGCSMGLISQDAPIAILCIGGIISSLLWTLGVFVSNTVGLILVSPDEERVCISYIDTKGRRCNDVFPVEDLVPIEDLPGYPAKMSITGQMWINLRRYSSLGKEEEAHYRLFIELGSCEITDEKRFTNIFGNLYR